MVLGGEVVSYEPCLPVWVRAWSQNRREKCFTGNLGNPESPLGNSRHIRMSAAHSAVYPKEDEKVNLYRPEKLSLDELIIVKR